MALAVSLLWTLEADPASPWEISVGALVLASGYDTSRTQDPLLLQVESSPVEYT